MIHKVYEPYIRARLGTAAHFCEVIDLKAARGTPAPKISRLVSRPVPTYYEPCSERVRVCQLQKYRQPRKWPLKSGAGNTSLEDLARHGNVVGPDKRDFQEGGDLRMAVNARSDLDLSQLFGDQLWISDHSILGLRTLNKQIMKKKNKRKLEQLFNVMKV